MSEQKAQPSVGVLEDRLEFETLIADASAGLLGCPPDEVERAVEHVLGRVREFFQADVCALLAARGEAPVVNVWLASYGEGAPVVPTDVDLAKAFPWARRKMLVEREAVRVARTAEPPPGAEVDREVWKQMGVRSVLALPIEVAGDVRHFFVVETVHRERGWPDALVTRVRLLGELLVGALERAETLAGLRRTEARLTSGADLAGLAFYELDLRAGAASPDARLRELLGVPADVPDGVAVREHWTARIHPDDRARVADLRAQLHAGRIAQISVEYRFLHPTRGLRWIHHLARVGKRDAAGNAVVTQGVLRDVTEQKRADAELADLSRRLIQAQEEERAMLARELHDDVTQRLAVLAIDVGRAELAARGGAQAETMRAVREALARLGDDVHALAYQLHPSVLEELGLAAALRMACERLQGRIDLALTVEIDPVPADLERAAALCLFRVAQEALTNVGRHARARAASLVLRRMEGGYLLTVRDDGAGFDAAAPRPRRSLGLASMRERVRLLDGSLDVESAPGRGTAVVAWVPAPEGGR